MKTGMIRAITLEDGDVMEFKELPIDVQKTAAHTLHSVLRDIGKDIESEPAKALARNINAAFIELYQFSDLAGSKMLEESLKRYATQSETHISHTSITISVEEAPLTEDCKKKRLNGIEIVETILARRKESSQRDYELLKKALSGRF